MDYTNMTASEIIEDILARFELGTSLYEDTSPIVIDSTAIVLDATPVMLPMPGEKKVEGKEC